MQYKKIIIYLFVISIFLIGCGNKVKTTEHKTPAPSAEEELKLDKNADIFMLGDRVYKTDIDWVNQLKLTKKNEIGEIESKYSISSDEPFKNKMATKLPAGSKIFSTNEREDVLIVQYKGIEKKYYVLSEG
ncbi:hypothetical protein ACIQ4I_01755 [Rummeliibacillus sp. NPDC094406]|uniref:hypothetical protein n=1 Tax=Rummeliibacillus sp. NPDC094406 TaxID=3364511 RepID=UPI0037F16F27